MKKILLVVSIIIGFVSCGVEPDVEHYGGYKFSRYTDGILQEYLVEEDSYYVHSYSVKQVGKNIAGTDLNLSISGIDLLVSDDKGQIYSLIYKRGNRTKYTIKKGNYFNKEEDEDLAIFSWTLFWGIGIGIYFLIGLILYFRKKGIARFYGTFKCNTYYGTCSSNKYCNESCCEYYDKKKYSLDIIFTWLPKYFIKILKTIVNKIKWFFTSIDKGLSGISYNIEKKRYEKIVARENKEHNKSGALSEAEDDNYSGRLSKD